MRGPGELVLVLMLAGSVAEAAAPAGEVEALVRKSVTAYGGRDALARAKVIRQTAKVTATVRRMAGEMTRLFEYPGRLRVEIAYPEKAREVRVLDRDAGWRDGSVVTGPPLDAMVLQAARMSMPLLLLERLGEVQDRGLVDSGGAKLRALALALPNQAEVIVELEPDTGLIRRTTTRGRGGIEFATEYDDFRKVRGVLFAFTERTFAMGRHTGETMLEKVEVLSAAPRGAFTP